MTKEELIKKTAELEVQVKDLNAGDEIVRKNISQFLGSFRQDYYSRQEEVKILRWSEIYFELGKLIANKNRLEDLTAVRSQVDYLIEQDRISREDKPFSPISKN